MILYRKGKKTRHASELIKYFPKHECFIDMFFGAGGLFFNKPKSKYNIINDLDGDVYNLYRTLLDNKDELIHYITITPISDTLFNEWASGKREATNVLNAVRFLFLSNFSLYGSGDTLRVGIKDNKKQGILNDIEGTFEFLYDVRILNKDYKDLWSSIVKTDISDFEDTFIYADPPYINTGNNYSTPLWTPRDLIELIEHLQATHTKFAISEFESLELNEILRGYDLYKYTILDRHNIKNRRIEVLLTNYPVNTKEQMGLFKQLKEGTLNE